MVDHGRIDSGGFATGYYLLMNAVCYIAEELTEIQSAPDLPDEARQRLCALLEYANYMQNFSEDYPSAKYNRACRP